MFFAALQRQQRLRWWKRFDGQCDESSSKKASMGKVEHNLAQQDAHPAIPNQQSLVQMAGSHS